MQENLFFLIYTSIMTPEQNPSCVANIIRVSRSINATINVTGLLVFDGMYFCQYLEGSRQSVLALSDKISRDKRHTDFMVREKDAMTGPRRFGDWSMGYALATQEALLPSLDRHGSASAVTWLESLLPKLALEPHD